MLRNGKHMCDQTTTSPGNSVNRRAIIQGLLINAFAAPLLTQCSTSVSPLEASDEFACNLSEWIIRLTPKREGAVLPLVKNLQSFLKTRDDGPLRLIYEGHVKMARKIGGTAHVDQVRSGVLKVGLDYFPSRIGGVPAIGSKGLCTLNGSTMPLEALPGDLRIGHLPLQSSMAADKAWLEFSSGEGGIGLPLRRMSGAHAAGTNNSTRRTMRSAGSAHVQALGTAVTMWRWESRNQMSNFRGQPVAQNNETLLSNDIPGMLYRYHYRYEIESALVEEVLVTLKSVG
jgi:hypothetical protein